MKKTSLLVRGSALTLALFSAMPVMAQTEVAAADDAVTESEESGIIVVTGSRIARPVNLDSPVPVTSVSAAELLDRGEVSLGDALNQLPSMRSTFSQANSTAFIGTAGLNLLDLRGLGTERTLVLVNGRRHITAQPGNYNVDVNTIPRELLERVDVVTGGNSAIYGSDAVAGVVNFIMKKDYEGIRLRGQGGVTTYGDRGSYSLGVVAGKNFGDGRFNITGAFEYAKSNPVFYTDRDYLGAYTGAPGFITSQITTAPNRNFDGIPNTSFVDGNPGVMFGNISLGGYVLTSCPAATAGNAAQRDRVCTGQLTPTGGRINYNFAFAPDGTLVRDDPTQGLVDNRAIGGGVLGGLSATGGEGAMLLPGLERYAANLMFNAELSPAFQPFIEAKYVRVTATQQSTQPTFIASTLPATFSINNPFLTPQARATLVSILNPGATTFTMQRFNNDFGTRAEDHQRDTYRVVAGVRGDLGSAFNLSYEAAFNYGRTETYYETGGNVHLQRYRNAIAPVVAPAGYGGSNFVLNSQGQRVICGINGDASTTNDDAACIPLNVFGNGAPSKEALNYILHTSSRKQWAEQINAQAFISGNSGSFELPGGPIGFALGVEYRREDAYSAYDAVTQAGATFLNAFQPFEPPALEVKEAFGEIRIPLLADAQLAHELTVEGSGRVSDYGGSTGAVWAYNVGAIWAPVPDIRLRVSYAKSVRAPNLNNLYATPGVTFQNGLTDPCDQAGGTNANNNITSNPNRVRNCRDAGIPTTITYTDGSGQTATIPWVNVPGSGVAGINRGNPDLVPEVGKSLTAGVILQPRFIPGLTVSIDYYDIKVENVISGLTGQAIINRCYDDPTGIDNVFCDAVSRRTSADNLINGTFDGQSSRRLQNTPDITLPSGGSAFFNQPFNFAALKTSGIDVDASYTRTLGADTRLSLRGIVSYLIRREQFTSITNPNFSTRLHGTLGDPVWAASFNANLDFGSFNFGYNMRYVGKMVTSGLAWETFFPHQDRTPTNPDARPFAQYKAQTYHNIRAGFDINENFEFYTGVDNLFNNLPPYDTVGNGSIAGDSIYPNTGRFYYAGFQAKF